MTHEPVTAVQLSRGKAEAQLLFEITLLTQDLGRLAADLLLFYTQEFGFVSLPEGFTTGSSIMPQKRNPDVFELMRGRSAVAQAALNEVFDITQKLPSGYHRDLQLIKPPLFRAIDSCLQTLDILPSALRRGAIQAQEHTPGSRHSRGGGGQRTGNQGKSAFPRRLPARRRQAQRPDMSAAGLKGSSRPTPRGRPAGRHPRGRRRHPTLAIATSTGVLCAP